MKGRVVVLDRRAGGGEAAALLVDGRLEDLLLDPKDGSARPAVGDIHLTRIVRKLPGKGGAFCDLGGCGQGFLREAHGLSAGDVLPVQVIGLPEPGKAVTVSARLLHKGPRIILTPGAPGINVSRQIRDPAERARLERALTEAFADQADPGLPPACGAILRSAAQGATDDDLSAELAVLAVELRAVAGLFHRGVVPDWCSIGRAQQTALRNWALPRPDRIVCAPDLHDRLARIDPAVGPVAFWGDRTSLSLLAAEPDPFARLGVDDEIDRLSRPLAPLGEGSLVIEQTRALVAVDVNTGADFSPAAGLKTNLAAARELPRQLRLRGLGGKVVIDFAPMPKKDRRTLEQALRAALRKDPVETSLAGWTTLGMFELQRKRERQPLAELL